MKASFENNDVLLCAETSNSMPAYPMQFHTHTEIIYVMSGQVTMTIDGVKRTLTSGQLSICFPYSVHEYEESKNAKILLVLFSAGATGAFEQDLLAKKPVTPYLENGAGLYDTLCKIIEFKKKGEGYEKNALAYLSAAVGEILSELDLYDIESTDTGTIQKILIYCSENFRESDMCLEKVAESLYISKSYISKIFAKKLKCNFREYINSLRVSEAKTQLKETDLKIIDIMENCGFKNQSSFNRVFFEECDITPREYRKGKQKQV